MSEAYPSAEQTQDTKKRFAISEEEVFSDSALTGRYFKERVEAFEAGEELWIVVGFGDSESTYDQDLRLNYTPGNKVLGGYVVGSPSEGYIAYRRPTKDEDGPQRLTFEEGLSLREAQIALERYVKKTVPTGDK